MFEIQDKKTFFVHKVLFSVYIIFLIAFIFTHYSCNLSLFFDSPAMFFNVIWANNSGEGPFNWFYLNDENARLFTNILVSVPYNIMNFFAEGKPVLTKINLFSLSYLLVQVFLLLGNYFAARRTKRYDIAIVAFAFYSIFCLPNMIWSVREVHITVLVYFILLQYFLSKTKLTKKDLLPVLLLIIYMYESFEITFVFGIILFVFMNLYQNRDEQNAWFRTLIGFGVFGASIYIPFKIFFVIFSKHLNVMGASGIREWIIGSKLAFLNFFHSNLIIVFFAIAAIVYIVFRRKNFGLRDYLFLIFDLTVMFIFLGLNTGFYASPGMELHNYSIVFWFIFPVILVLILFDYFNIQINESFFANLFVIACVFGCINLSWQIYSNIEHGKYINYLKNLMSKSEQVIVKIPENDYKENRFINSYNTCFGLAQRSIALSYSNKVILPSGYFNDYSEYCFADKSETNYNEQRDILRLQTTYYKVKTKYWDLTPIIEEFKKQGLLDSNN